MPTASASFAPLRAIAGACLAIALLAGPAAASSDTVATPAGVMPADEEPDDPGATPSPVATPERDPEAPTPTPDPTARATPEPTPDPTPEPTPDPTPDPTATPGPTPTASPTPDPTAPTPAWAGRLNLYRKGAWVRQYTNYTCTAASAQTMLNLVRHKSDRTVITQMRIIRWARAHDSLDVSRGSDPAGWASALRHFGGGKYAWKTFRTRAAALRYAAKRLAVTRRPVGLLVWRGRHAWTMVGFTSATDPRMDPQAKITGIYVAPPLVGTDPKPNTYLRAARLGTFARYAERDGLRAWVNRWVVVAP